jgi:glyoxylase-like metal-dependent hydrolase (beta-lactamase superfamily II)
MCSIRTAFRILLGMALPMLLCSRAHALEELTLKPVKLTPHVYYFEGQAGMAAAANKGYMSNAGFVVTRDGVVVFDALATPALGRAMLKAIAQVTSQPVVRVIVSHFHADHFYGLQAFKEKGAEVWGHEAGKVALASEAAEERLAQRRKDLAPWVDAATRLVPADRWLSFADGKTIAFEQGGIRFRVIDSSGAHSPEDIMLFVDDDGVLFAGDLFATGRIPFVGTANSKAWLEALDQMTALSPAIAVPGHGAASRDPGNDIRFTRDYLIFLRQTMSSAVADMTPFDEAYRNTDWSRFRDYPAFQQANRLNAYDTYLLMEKESLAK